MVRLTPGGGWEVVVLTPEGQEVVWLIPGGGQEVVGLTPGERLEPVDCDLTSQGRCWRVEHEIFVFWSSTGSIRCLSRLRIVLFV